MRYSLEIESDDRAYSGSTYKSLYNKRREIIEKNYILRNFLVNMNQQIDLMVAMCNENPTEAIG